MAAKESGKGLKERTQAQTRMDSVAGRPLSALGFGCMRFPKTLAGGFDLAKTTPLIVDAVERGVNYFDTAYVYGNSEETLGQILQAQKLRDRIYIATKLPVFAVHIPDDFERIFNEQLRRLRTDHIDYYLMHNMASPGSWTKMKELGAEEWIAKKKASGAIKQIGFSFHGPKDAFIEILESYPWEFVQIQYNYLNPRDQAGVDGMKAAAAKGLPVIIMEPLLGGKLANPPKRASAIFAASAHPDWSPAQWGIRWLLNQPEPTVILSGMNAPEQLDENIRAAIGAKPGHLTEADMAVYDKVREVFTQTYRIKCTGCGYCMPCPKKVNIPGCFAAYNMSYGVSYMNGMVNYLTTAGVSNPDHYMGVRNCGNCGRCVKKCPQGINIPDEFKRIRRRLDFPFIQPAARLLLGRNKKKRQGAAI